MSTFTTAADLNKLRADLAEAKLELGTYSIERESARLHLLVGRLIAIVESLDERTRGLEAQLKKLSGDGK